MKNEKHQSVIPSDDNKRIIPTKPWPGDELIHHILMGAMIALERGETSSAEHLLEVVLSQKTRNRWIYHCVAGFHLALLKVENDIPRLSLLQDCLRTNPSFPDALEIYVRYDRKNATKLIHEATGLDDLDVDDFLSIVKTGIWKHYCPFRDSDDIFCGADLLDVGARHGFHGLIFLSWGGRRYTATDLAIDSFAIRQLKNQRSLNHDIVSLNFTMKDLAHRHPDRLNLIIGETEHLNGKRFDYITLFSVTEHLKPPAKPFSTLCKALSPLGKIFITHHNFFCWNGHHARPKSVPQLQDMIDKGEDYSLADWNFFEKPLAESLNRLTPAQLRREVEHYFKVQNWELVYTAHGKGLERLSPQIVKRVAPLSIEDILTQSIHSEPN